MSGVQQRTIAISNTLLIRFFINYFAAQFFLELYLKIQIFTFSLKDFVQLFSDFLHINFLRLQFLNRHCQFCIKNCVAQKGLHHWNQKNCQFHVVFLNCLELSELHWRLIKLNKIHSFITWWFFVLEYSWADCWIIRGAKERLWTVSNQTEVIASQFYFWALFADIFTVILDLHEHS